ncbi:Sm1 protein [Fistulina hepatica ATCC 64428]|uniref:Sm1 protein n=1 Tax=Fistulina hepatica ATCC 64428 TaxID=1128425 RepID=A0A0D7AHL2_9AGAR|nr:Sm1 protein [Fistulina hepatica ATCC 64428]
MKFLAVFSALLAVATGAFAVSVTYDEAYDDASTSLTTVSCSDGTNGLITKGYSTFGSIPDFPYIGGADAIAGWNSANCGTCWTLYYSGTGLSVNVLAIDHAGSGFNIALETMNALTNNQAQDLGTIDVTATQVNASTCGL